MASKKAKDQDGEALPGFGDSLPVGKKVLGLTQKRLLVFKQGAMSGKPTALELSIPIGDVAAMEHEKKRIASGLSIRFTDGSERSFEAPRGGQDFVDAFHQVTGRKAA